MIELATILLVLTVFSVMTTLGSVLLVRFVIPGAAKGKRVFAAAFLGPASVLLPILTFALIDETSVLVTVSGFILVLLGAGVAIGWPVAHLATRRLDRLTRFDVETFE